MANLGNGIAGVAVSILAYIITKAIYNLYFHPLSKFPGPPFWAAFQFPYLNAMLGGRLPYHIKELHDKYGSVVRISPGELSFNDPDAWKDIYTSKEFIRPKEWRSLPPGVKAHSVISADVATHTRFRKALSLGFSEKAVKLQEPIITQYIDLLISKLRQEISEKAGGKTSATVDLVSWINFTTFDIISDLGWGESFHCLEKQEYHPWVMVILQFKAIMIGAAINYYPLLQTLIPYITPPSALAGLNMVISTSAKNVRARLEKTERPDVMSFIIRHNDSSPETALSEEEIMANSMALIVGGSDSLTSALAGTINCLLSHADAMKALVSEIRSAFEEERDITAKSTKPLKYLTAVLQEGMRIFPPFPDNMHRAVPSGGASIAGYWLNEGTTVGIPCYSMFRSASNFSSPEKFLPERWLDTRKISHFEKDRHEAFHPFSMGPHGCLGQQLAWMELRVILCRLLWNFDLVVPNGKEVGRWTEQDIFWSWDKKPMEVEISLVQR